MLQLGPEFGPELGSSVLAKLHWLTLNSKELRQLCCRWATRNEGVGSSSLPVGFLESCSRPSWVRRIQAEFTGPLSPGVQQELLRLKLGVERTIGIVM